MKRLKRAAALLLSLLILAAVTVPAASASVKVIGGRDNDDMKIALTFDDGPHPKNTPEILDILKKYGVRATFFEVGENVSYYPDVARRVAAEGHEIGNHTFSHPHLARIDYAALSREVSLCESAITEVTGVKPTLFRPPEGVIDDNVKKIAENGDYSVILWTVDTRDWARTPADKIVKTVLDNISSGDIILMHDYTCKCHTAAALERLLPALSDLGYEFVTVSELLSI